MHGLGSPRASLTGDQRTSLREFGAPRYFSAPHFLMLSILFVPPMTSLPPQSAHSPACSLHLRKNRAMRSDKFGAARWGLILTPTSPPRLTRSVTNVAMRT